MGGFWFFEWSIPQAEGAITPPSPAGRGPGGAAPGAGDHFRVRRPAVRLKGSAQADGDRYRGYASL